MHQLLIATNNKGKIKELQELLSDTGIQLVTPAQIHLDLDVVEDGLTYEANAAKKAAAFAHASGLISLADDSGLEVDALGGAPGLYSARYGSDLALPPVSASPKMEGVGGGPLSDGGRRNYLVQQLQDKPRPWTARFHATIAIAIPNHVTLSEAKDLGENQAQTLQVLHFPGATYKDGTEISLAEGFCQGEIIPEERGTGGFGYDPIFLLPELGKTMAELTMDEKNRLSHRARAVMNAKPTLERLFSQSG
ncbi:MAG: non-canonical purine NTP pyrophosphatase [Chloroflexota bacterium]